MSHYPPRRNPKTLWQNMPLGLNTQQIPAKLIQQSAAQARENCREERENRATGREPSFIVGPNHAKNHEMKYRYEKQNTIIGNATKYRSKDGVI